MGSVRALASATYEDIVHRPLYYVLVGSLAVMIFLSQYITLFSFHQEMNLVREMGMASLTFFGFLVTLILSGVIVTKELEDRTAVTLLSKPVSRPAFLLGKFLGLIGAIAPGILILSGVLFVTLWFMAKPAVFGSDAFVWAVAHPASGEEAIPVMLPKEESTLTRETRGSLEICWRYFVRTNGGVVLQGAVLSFFQVMILAALGVSMAAFFPVVVSSSATALFFVLGNVSSYMLAAAEKWQVGALTWGARALYTLVPNLGYFNLQTFYSEGKLISLRYLGVAALYAVGYTTAVFLVSCAAFRRREIR